MNEIVDRSEEIRSYPEREEDYYFAEPKQDTGNFVQKKEDKRKLSYEALNRLLRKNELLKRENKQLKMKLNTLEEHFRTAEKLAPAFGESEASRKESGGKFSEASRNRGFEEHDEAAAEVRPRLKRNERQRTDMEGHAGSKGSLLWGNLQEIQRENEYLDREIKKLVQENAKSRWKIVSLDGDNRRLFLGEAKSESTREVEKQRADKLQFTRRNCLGCKRANKDCDARIALVIQEYKEELKQMKKNIKRLEKENNNLRKEMQILLPQASTINLVENIATALVDAKRKEHQEIKQMFQDLHEFYCNYMTSTETYLYNGFLEDCLDLLNGSKHFLNIIRGLKFWYEKHFQKVYDTKGYDNLQYRDKKIKTDLEAAFLQEMPKFYKHKQEYLRDLENVKKIVYDYVADERIAEMNKIQKRIYMECISTLRGLLPGQHFGKLEKILRDLLEVPVVLV
ncbi:polyamine-modulated factor 1-binding protein 1-like [Macrobrachium nipponense]|uniref:polyamine-modulated factor 1-binding protein 1-like n=1 Tax=Macrobrachium nipponense TaxID=159736 RepID=UPI0030C829A8